MTGPLRTRPPGPVVVPSECQQPREVNMADDPIELEKKLRENAERMAEVRRQLIEQPSDMSQNNWLQDELGELERKRDQLNERWGKVTTENEG